jgi:hypothetical protein
MKLIPPMDTHPYDLTCVTASYCALLRDAVNFYDQLERIWKQEVVANCMSYRHSPEGNH